MCIRDSRTTDVTGVTELPEGTEMVMPGDNVTMEVELITPIAIEPVSYTHLSRSWRAVRVLPFLRVQSVPDRLPYLLCSGILRLQVRLDVYKRQGTDRTASDNAGTFCSRF